MSTTLAVCTDVIPSVCNDAITPVRSYVYVTVQEMAEMLDKRKTRLYEMVQEGLLHDVGFLIVRTKKGRIWIGIPKCGPSKLALTDTRGGP